MQPRRGVNPNNSQRLFLNDPAIHIGGVAPLRIRSQSEEEREHRRRFGRHRNVSCSREPSPDRFVANGGVRADAAPLNRFGRPYHSNNAFVDLNQAFPLAHPPQTQAQHFSLTNLHQPPVQPQQRQALQVRVQPQTAPPLAQATHPHLSPLVANQQQMMATIHAIAQQQNQR